MRAVSLFSGAGGFELGFDRAGIETLVQVEKDPYCLEVLARHWPHTLRVTNVGSLGLRLDARRVSRNGTTTHDEPVARNGTVAGFTKDSRRFDLVYGGWPCQDLSVAGQRAGLSGDRSGLFHEFVRVLRELRPRWIAAENVLGLLSSAGGRDFGIVLNSLVELGYGVAWRVLDGRWFGVPQRRRRVLLVGCLGDARRAAQVLAVCESCSGHPAPSRKTREDLAPTLDDGARGVSVELPMIPTLSPGAHPGGLTGREAENGNYVIASAVRASDGHHGYSSGRGDGADNLVIADPISAHEGKTYTHEGRNNFRTHNVIAFHSKDHGQDAEYDVSPTVRAAENENGGTPPAISDSFGVRRLTPLECERLMGWPDEHTRWTSDGREISDSHRYRLCGNGVIATMAEWLGHRLVAANAW